WGDQRRRWRGQAGRHPELRRRPGADRLQQQHLLGQRHLGGEHRHQHDAGCLPPPARLQGRDERSPARLGRADQREPADGRLQDQAGRGLVGRRPDLGRRLHLPVEEPQRDHQGQRRLRHHRLRPDEERHRVRQRQDGHGGLQDPLADWKSMFASGNFILPAHYVEKTPGGWNTGLKKNPEKIPSGGWFKIQNWTQGQSLTLVRNDKYWGKKSNLDSLVVRFLPESTTQPAALQNNEVDLIYPQPQLDQVQQVKALPDVTSQINFGPTFEHFDFNFKNAQLGDLKVRQAIATGINVQELVDRTVKQFSDKAEPLGNRIYMKTQPDQYQDHFGQYGKGDVAGATKLLEEAGYTKGGDGIYAKGGKKLSVRRSTTAGNQLRETQEELFQAQMKKIGVDIKIANADSTKFFGEWLPNGNFDIANFAWVGSPFPISGNRSAYVCNSGSNSGQYCKKKGDRGV